MAFIIALSLTVLVGCGNKEVGDSTTVQLYMWDSGLDIDWMQEIIKKYNAKQSTYKVEATYNSNAATIIQTLDSGSGNYYDLYFTMLNTYKHNDDFIDMSWILSEKAEGENVTIGDKYYKGLLNSLVNADGVYKYLNYGNTFVGIVYNKGLMDQTSFKDDVPRTTDELKYLSAELNAKDIKTWMFYNDDYNNGYWNYISDAWTAQYNGLDNFNNILQGLGGKNATLAESKEVFLTKDGRYEALKAMESVITYSNTHSKCASTNFTDCQNLFMNGASCLNVNGGWLLKEYSKSGGSLKEDIRFMKLPVISSIVNTFEGEDAKMSDETLSEIIKVIDEGGNESTLCSSKTFARIKEARNLMYNNAPQQYVFIPQYSNAIEGAKDFSKYFYSDEATKIFIEKTGLPSSVALSDKSVLSSIELSDWSKQMIEYADTITAISSIESRSKIFIDTTLNLYASVVTAQNFRLGNGNNKTADQIWAEIESKIERNWSDWTE